LCGVRYNSSKDNHDLNYHGTNGSVKEVTVEKQTDIYHTEGLTNEKMYHILKKKI